MLLQSGTILQNRYRITRVIGRGGMGAVYQAVDRRLGNYIVAVKQIVISGRQLERAFEREAQLLARLKHPALIRVIDYFRERNGLFLVMDYIPGDDLGALLEQQGHPFSVEQVLTWADQLLGALEYLHSQQSPVIHRDIKPSNIKVSPEGQVILLDFGIAKGGLMEDRTTSVTAFTPGYAPPEQIVGQFTDGRSDLYALGATLYHLLTGVLPPHAVERMARRGDGSYDSLRSANEMSPQVPEAVAKVLQQAMNLDPSQRFQSAEHMRVALQAAQPSAATTKLPSAKTVFPSSPVGTLPTVPPRTKKPTHSNGLLDKLKVFLVWLIGILESAKNKTEVSESYPDPSPSPDPSVITDWDLPPESQKGPAATRQSEPSSGKQTPITVPFPPPPRYPPPPPPPPRVRTSVPNPHTSKEPPVTLIRGRKKVGSSQKTIFPVPKESTDIFNKQGIIIEDLLSEHLQAIIPKLNRAGGTRLFLTGFGSFGGTSLVRATTAKFMQNFAVQALVIRLESPRRRRSGKYKLFVNENWVDRVEEPINEKELLEKINLVLRQTANSKNAQTSNPFGRVDFFEGMTARFAQDTAYGQAITTLISQVLKLLQSGHDERLLRQALDNLLATPSQAKQVVLIIDTLEQSEAMERLLDCPMISEKESYPWLSLIVVARHQHFNGWAKPLRQQISGGRFTEYYYVRRLWSPGPDVQHILNHLMQCDISVLEAEDRQRFEKVLTHLTYKARGSVAKVMGELINGHYFLMDRDEMAMNLQRTYKRHKEDIEHNCYVQKILNQHWLEILGHGLVDRVETTDQAKVGVYYVIEWMRDNSIFKLKALHEAAAKEKITLSDKEPIRQKILSNLLRVLEENNYLQYQPAEDCYLVARQQKSKTIQPKHKRPSKRTTKPLHIALLGDETHGGEQVVSLATQIALEAVEAGHCLVMTDRGGIEGVVREKLEPYWSLYVEDFPNKEGRLSLISTSNATRPNSCEKVLQTFSTEEQIKRLLEKADVIVLVQAHGASDSAFVRDVKKMAKREGVPIIEPLADLEPAESFFVPEEARRVVEAAEKACGIAVSSH